MELELNMLAVLQYDFDFEFPFPYVKQYFSIFKQTIPADSSLAAKLSKMESDALKITLDTYILFDYFLFYSPHLLAAASVHLCLQFNIG